MTYLVEIKSFEDLKAKYREWALKLHPDMGGTDAEMQVLNNEYDQLFPVWKNRSEVHTKETADSDRRWFYTQNGWAGKNYKSGRTTKEIAEISEPISRKSTAIASGVCVILPLRCVPAFPLP